ncbi:2-succinylbenzoate--CoA ligase [Kluyvera intermedia]|nr:2-succinylbenzoate--CoA ligase [Kluyvera intermedia]
MFATWPWRHWRTQRGDAPALRLDDETLSWSTLCQRIDQFAAGFQAQGVNVGDGVALCARNQPDAVLAWLALLQCGARIFTVESPFAFIAGLRTVAGINLASHPESGERRALQPRTAALFRYHRVYRRGLAGATLCLYDAYLWFNRIAKSGRTHLCGASGER